MGCVRDKSWTQAVMEVYPNRKPYHSDARKRKELSSMYRDIPELANKSCVHEARRYYNG